MLPKKPLKLKHIKSKDLSGFQHLIGHYVELKHGLMGCFPAIIDETNEMIICTDKNVLLDILETLPRKECKFGELQMLVNIKDNIGFVLNHFNQDEAEAERIFTKEEFEQRKSSTQQPYRWAAGVISLKSEPTEEEFQATLKAARANCA